MRNTANIFRIVVMLVMLVLGGTAPAFAQEILATFGLGGQFSSYVFENIKIPGGMTAGVNVFFIGKSGLAISAGADVIWENIEYDDFPEEENQRIDINPMFGLGYVYYRMFYVGGILNLVYKPNIAYYWEIDDYFEMYLDGDAFIAPTFVAGFDFGRFVLGGQLSYMRGVMSGVNSFRFVFAMGINVGKGW